MWYDRVVVEDVIAALQTYLAAHGDEVVAAYVFGSVARGTARADSDVDVGIVTTTARGGTLASLHLDLEGELERLLGREVQLVVLDWRCSRKRARPHTTDAPFPLPMRGLSRSARAP